MSSICWCQVCTSVRYVLVSDMCHCCTTLIFCDSLCTKLHCTAHFLTVLQFQCELCTDCNCTGPQWRMMVNRAKILMSCQIEILPGFCRQIRLCTLHTAFRERNLTHITKKKTLITQNTYIAFSKQQHFLLLTPMLFNGNTNSVYSKHQIVHSIHQHCSFWTATMFTEISTLFTQNIHIFHSRQNVLHLEILFKLASTREENIC